MNTKEMMASIVTAMLVVALIAVMIGPASAGTTNASKLANRTVCPIGGAIEYTLEVTNNDPNRDWTFKVYDQYANDAEIQVGDEVEDLPPGDSWTGTITFPVEDGDESSEYPGYVFNNLRYSGQSTITGDCVKIPIGGNCGEFVRIIIDISFTFVATCCEGATVTPEWSGPVAWHQWIIDGVAGPVINTAPTPKELTSCGSYVVTLKGGPDIDDLDNYEEFSDTIYIACEPEVRVEPIPGCVDVGDSVEFRLESLTNDTPIDTYEWTFTNGVPGSGVLSWDGDPTITRTIPAGGTTATLKVTDDLGCYDTDSVSVSTCPPQEVPILTPAGMVALIGMLCIVGAGRILTKGRRS